MSRKKEKILPVKFRFANRDSESWMARVALWAEEYDWSKVPVGVHNARPLTFSRDGRDVCNIWPYNTKTQRIVYISANIKFTYP
jgi:hypothetical protein